MKINRKGAETQRKERTMSNNGLSLSIDEEIAMDKEFPCFTIGEGFIYKWRECIQSSFPRILLDLIVRADDNNLEKIRKGFPLQVEAWEEWHKDGAKYEKMLDAKVEDWKQKFAILENKGS